MAKRHIARAARDRGEIERKRRIADRLRELVDKPEVARSAILTGMFAENLTDRRMTPPEMFEAAYGDASGAAYWETQLSARMPLVQFAILLATHLAENIDRQPLHKLAVINAIKDADADGATFVTRTRATQSDRKSPDETLTWAAKQNARNRQSWNLDSSPDDCPALTIEPRAAVEWLRLPKRAHLLPSSLRAHLGRARPAEPAAGAPLEQAEVGRRRSRSTQLAAAKNALAALFPPPAPVLGQTKAVANMVNDWLRDRGVGQVSVDTVGRAIRERAETANSTS